MAEWCIRGGGTATTSEQSADHRSSADLAGWGASVTEVEGAVIAAAIGGLAALIAALVAAGVALRNETRRRSAARVDAERQALRGQAAEVFRHMFTLQQEMEWLTWYAANRPAAASPETAASYEDAVHKTYPSLLGAMAVLASLDMDLYESLKPLAEQLYAEDDQIALLIAGLTSAETRQDSLAGLKACHGPVIALYESLPPEMAKAMQLADTKHAARGSE
jgi:hypothetical protein